MALHVTQCPACQSSFNISAAMLELARGKVRCGSCLTIFHAIDNILNPLPSEETNEVESVFIGNNPEDYFDPTSFITRSALQEKDNDPDETPMGGKYDQHDVAHYHDGSIKKDSLELSGENTKDFFEANNQITKKAIRDTQSEEQNFPQLLQTSTNYFEDSQDGLISETGYLNPELFPNSTTQLASPFAENTEHRLPITESQERSPPSSLQQKNEKLPVKDRITSEPTAAAEPSSKTEIKRVSTNDKRYRDPAYSIKATPKSSAPFESKTPSLNAPKDLQFTPSFSMQYEPIQQRSANQLEFGESTEEAQTMYPEHVQSGQFYEALPLTSRTENKQTEIRKQISDDFKNPINTPDKGGEKVEPPKDESNEDNIEIIRARALKAKLDEDSELEVISEENIAAIDVSSAPVELLAGTHTKWGRRILRGLVTLTLGGGLISQYLWANMITYSQDIRVRPLYEFVCNYAACELPDYFDINAIRSETLIVQSHAELRNALTVNIEFRNTAAFPQAFPVMVLSFNSTSHEIVALRELSPEEYLDPSLRDFSMMPVMTPIQVNLDIIDPGPDAVNYTLAFRLP